LLLPRPNLGRKKKPETNDREHRAVEEQSRPVHLSPMSVETLENAVSEKNTIECSAMDKIVESSYQSRVRAEKFDNTVRESPQNAENLSHRILSTRPRFDHD